MSEEKKREVKHTKDDILDTYTEVLVFLIENRYKSFTKSEIGKHIFRNDYHLTEKNMVSRCVNRLIDTEILRLVTETIDDNGKTIELPSNQSRVRLYNKDIDDKDNEEFYIDFKIPNGDTKEDKEKRINLSKTLSLMLKGNIGDYGLTIYDDVVRNIMESNMYGLQRGFVSQTVGRMMVKHHNYENEGNYPLDLLHKLISLETPIDVVIENESGNLQLNNTKISKITINENTFDIHFNNIISQNQSDINQIKSIKPHSEDTLSVDIQKLSGMLDGLEIPKEEIDSLEKLIRETLSPMDMFEF